jgi:hypothetical protein
MEPTPDLIPYRIDPDRATGLQQIPAVNDPNGPDVLRPAELVRLEHPHVRPREAIHIPADPASHQQPPGIGTTGTTSDAVAARPKRPYTSVGQSRRELGGPATVGVARNEHGGDTQKAREDRRWRC